MHHPRPLFDELAAHYPDVWQKTRFELFDEIGWERELNNPAFTDTCAIRGSIGLLSVGVPVQGRVQILKGPLKGKWIEPGQAKLTHWLASYWGPPDMKLKTKELFRLAGRCGVISHFNIHPNSPLGQGHFDVLSPTAGDPFHCASLCHWGAAETWFWELPRGLVVRERKRAA